MRSPIWLMSTVGLVAVVLLIVLVAAAIVYLVIQEKKRQERARLRAEERRKRREEALAKMRAEEESGEAFRRALEETKREQQIEERNSEKLSALDTLSRVRDDQDTNLYQTGRNRFSTGRVGVVSEKPAADAADSSTRQVPSIPKDNAPDTKAQTEPDTAVAPVYEEKDTRFDFRKWASALDQEIEIEKPVYQPEADVQEPSDETVDASTAKTEDGSNVLSDSVSGGDAAAESQNGFLNELSFEIEPDEDLSFPASFGAFKADAAKPAPTPVQKPVKASVPEPAAAPVPEPVKAAASEPAAAPVPEPVKAAASEPAAAPAPEPVPEPVKAVVSEPAAAPAPEPVKAVVSEPAAAPVPEPVKAAVSEPAAAPAPEPVKAAVSEPAAEPAAAAAPETAPEKPVKERTSQTAAASAAVPSSVQTVPLKASELAMQLMQTVEDDHSAEDEMFDDITKVAPVIREKNAEKKAEKLAEKQAEYVQETVPQEFLAQSKTSAASADAYEDENDLPQRSMPSIPQAAPAAPAPVQAAAPAAQPVAAAQTPTAQADAAKAAPVKPEPDETDIYDDEEDDEDYFDPNDPETIRLQKMAIRRAEREARMKEKERYAAELAAASDKETGYDEDEYDDDDYYDDEYDDDDLPEKGGALRVILWIIAALLSLFCVGAILYLMFGQSLFGSLGSGASETSQALQGVLEAVEDEISAIVW